MCVNGPPEKQNLKDEADTFMHVIAAHYVSITDFSIFFFRYFFIFCVLHFNFCKFTCYHENLY